MSFAMKNTLPSFPFARKPRRDANVFQPQDFALPALLFPLLFSLFALPLAAREIPAVPAAKAGLSEAKLAEVDQFMERSVSDQKLAGAIVLVSHDGKIGFFHTYGQMDREAKKPMQPDTIFRLYSMSKAITTAAALSLYDA